AGKSRLALKFAQEHGAKLLTARDLFRASGNAPNEALEGPLLQLIEQAFARRDVVIFDDFDLLAYTLEGGQLRMGYVRPGFWAASMQAIFDFARDNGKCIIFTAGNADFPLAADRARRVVIAQMGFNDYAFHLEQHLGDLSASIDP